MLKVNFQQTQNQSTWRALSRWLRDKSIFVLHLPCKDLSIWKPVRPCSLFRDLGVKARAVNIDTSCSRLNRQIINSFKNNKRKNCKQKGRRKCQISVPTPVLQTTLVRIWWPSPLHGRSSPSRRLQSPGVSWAFIYKTMLISSSLMFSPCPDK